MIVARVMTKNPVTITPQDSLAEARHRMTKGLFRRLPVVEGGKLVAILTDRDLRKHEGYFERTKVNAAMIADPIAVASSAPVERAAAMMIKRTVGGLPVVDNGKLVGIVTRTDLVRAFVDMLGAHPDDAARIDVELDGELDRVAAALEIAAGRCGQVMGVGSYAEDGEAARVFFLRVPAADAHAVAKSLRENDFRVLAVHV
jgi:acetoin utilization protein AcuB